MNVHCLGFGHLSRCLITNCVTKLSAKPSYFFADYNVYSMGSFLLEGQAYASDQWDAYREKTELDLHSRLGPAAVDATGKVTVPKDSSAYGIEKPVDLSEPILLHYGAQ